MNRSEYRIKWLTYHRSYERQAFPIFRAALRVMVGAIPFGNLTYENGNAVIAVNIPIRKKVMLQAYKKVFVEIGLKHGRRVGRAINDEVKQFRYPLFSEEFQALIMQWVEDHCGEKITSASDTLVKYMQQVMAYCFKNNMPVEEMRDFVEAAGRGKISKRQALVIARTEVTAAANFATEQAGKSSRLILDRVWVSSHDARTRRISENDEWDHMAMDGVRVPQDEPFVMRSRSGKENRIFYPGGPEGDASNVICCRCTHALVPRRDANGRIMRRTG